MHVSALLLLAASAAASTVWSDWDKRQVCHPSQFLRPNSIDAVVSLLRSLDGEKTTQVKVVGSGHSFSSITLTDNVGSRHRGGPAGTITRPTFTKSVMLSLDAICNITQPPTWDEEEGGYVVRVGAGIRVHNLNDQLLDLGFALANTGAIAQQSVAGATQTGTHGTGRELGNMATQLTSLTLVLPNATVVTASRSENRRIFDAARVGLGALGIVVEVGLKVRKKFKLRRTTVAYNLDELLPALPSLSERYPRLQWYYTPYTNNATLLLREAVDIGTEITGCWPGDLAELAASAQGGNSSCVDWSFKALCHEADDATLYTEMEYFVPVEKSMAFFQEFREFQESVKEEINCTEATKCALFTGMRYAKQDDIYLSPVFGRDIGVISMIVLGTPTQSGPPDVVSVFDKGLEQIAKKYSGRPHWGKLHFARRADLEPLYPRFQDFKAVREELDPNGMFLNDYLWRVLYDE
mmetsp:Transcript_23474/g.37842  ORF Transcript_23474/g.37842 Transcript_23474/m.37842 type:complete len:466 (+) Transcript_23474:15-1412(+)